GLTVAAATRMRTSPGPGCGTGRSTTSRTSGPPSRENVTARMSVAPSELPVVPADDFLGADLEHDALRRAGRGPRAHRRRIRLCHRPSLERRPHRSLALDDLASAADHDAAQLAVLVTGFDHHRHLGIAANVDDLLSLAVRGHIEGAVAGEVVHRHDV